MTDKINKPTHYTSCPSGIECIEITELLPFCLGNTYKYLHRAGLKDDKIEDFKKALWYAKRAFNNGEKLTELAQKRIKAVAFWRGAEWKDTDFENLLYEMKYFGEDYSPFQFLVALEEYINNLEQ